MKNLFIAVICLAFVSSVFGQSNHNSGVFSKIFNPQNNSQYIQQSKFKYQNVLPKQAVRLGSFSDYIYTLDSLIEYNYNMVGTKNPIAKNEYRYNFKQQLVNYIQYQWGSNTWYFTSKQDWSYLEGENLARVLIYSWDHTYQEWELVDKEEYTYDNSENLKLYEQYELEDDSSWRIYRRIENEYDGSGKLLTYHQTLWNQDTVLTYEEQIEYEYNNDNNLELETRYELNDETMEVELHWKVEYYYNNGNLSPILSFDWRLETSEWEPTWIGEYTYNEIGKALSEKYSSWIPSLESWKPQWRYEYEYDNNTNPAARINYLWMLVSEEWKLNSKNEFDYNLDYKYSDIVIPFSDRLVQDYPDDIVNMPNEYVHFTRNEDEWNSTYSHKYYYSEVNLGIENQSGIEVNLFPNPANNYLNIAAAEQIHKVRIFNSLGQVSLEFDVNETKANLSNAVLTSGIYFITIYTKNAEMKRKLIVD